MKVAKRANMPIAKGNKTKDFQKERGYPTELKIITISGTLHRRMSAPRGVPSSQKRFVKVNNKGPQIRKFVHI